MTYRALLPDVAELVPAECTYCAPPGVDILVYDSEAAFWQKRHDRFGDIVRTTILGTMKPESPRYVGRTIVAIHFNRGTTWREYFWTAEGMVGDVGPIERPPTAQFFPISRSFFVAFDPAEARSTTICVSSGRDADTLRVGRRRRASSPLRPPLNGIVRRGKVTSDLVVE